MPPAARISDMHVCPMIDPGPKPHVGGPVISGAPTVLIAMMPSARLSDKCTCVGPVDSIVKGEPTVLVSKKPAARMGDSCSHGGTVVSGAPTVMIGAAKSKNKTTSKPCNKAARKSGASFVKT